MNSRTVSRLLLPACLGCASLPTFAQNMLTVPMEVAFVNNPNLVPEGVGDDARRGNVTLYRLSPQYTLALGAGTSSRTELTLGALIERSSDTALSANRSLPNVGVRWEGRGPTSIIGLRASLAETSTRETAFTDFGRVAIDSTERTATIGATWTRELTPSTSVELETFHARVEYDTPVLRDYQETGANVRYRWQSNLNHRYSLTGGTVRQRQDRDAVGAANRISRNELVLGYEVDLSPSVMLAANAGVARTNAVDSRTHAIGGFRLVNEGERLTYSVEWARSVSSDGTARGFTRADTLGGSVGYFLTANTLFTVGASRARSLDGERDEGTLAYARVRTELTSFWSVTGGLQHRRARSAGAPFARGHEVTVGLIYSHPDF
jgi:hypothetical protein